MSSVTISETGLYEVTYTATDESGNSVSIVRTVSVSSLASDPVDVTTACGIEPIEENLQCAQDTNEPVTFNCPTEPNENPLETVCIPCGSRIYGCTNPTALNYNIRATHDDGSCVFLQPPTITYSNQALPVGQSFEFFPSLGGGTPSKIETANATANPALPPLPSWVGFDPRTGRFFGFAPLNFDSFGVRVCVLNAAGTQCSTFTISPVYPPIIYGCTNRRAVNYNPLATHDDGSCQIVGCRDPQSPNYDPEANVDGFCVKLGCTTPTALNWDPFANTDDGSCIFCKDPFVSIRPIGLIDWGEDLTVCGIAYQAASVTIQIQGSISKTVSVVNNEWCAVFPKNELASIKPGKVEIKAIATTECGTSQDAVDAFKEPVKNNIPFFIGITASTGSERSVQTISNFVINGETAIVDPKYTSGGAIELKKGTWRLTDNVFDSGGGIWSQYPVLPERVKVSFDYTIGGDSAADGFALIFSASPFLSGLGGGLGYQGGNPKSIAVEIDSYRNEEFDPNNSHIALIWKGSVYQHLELASVAIRPGGKLEVDIENNLLKVRLNGGLLFQRAIELDKILQGKA